MKIVSLLTTWNRPKLLEQSLKHIERESADVGAHLVIADDQSDNYQTLKLLEGAEKRGAIVIKRPYMREQGQNPHYLVGLNAQFAFLHCVNKLNADLVCKFDDDIALMPGAFSRLLLAREQALEDGHKVLATSGIKGMWEPLVYAPEGRAYRIVATPCAAMCLYEKEDLRICFSEISSGTIATNGWDWTVVNEYRNKWKGDHIFISTAPGSVCYHAGHTGVHVANIDINKDYEGSLDGIYTE